MIFFEDKLNFYVNTILEDLCNSLSILGVYFFVYSFF